MKKGYIKIAASTIFWGSLPLVSRFLYAHNVKALEAAAMRTYIAAIILVAFALVNGSFKTFKSKDIPFYIFNGLFAVTGTSSFYMLAILHLNNSMAAILLYTAPAFVAIFLRLIYKTPISKAKIITLVFTFFGCFLVVKAYDATALSMSIIGIIFGIMSGICYAMLTVFGVKGLKMYSPQLNTTMQTVFGALFFLFIQPPWSINISLELTIGYIALGVVGSVVPSFLYLSGINDGVEGTIASILAYIEPVFVTITGVLLLNDVLEAPQVIGIVLVLAGALYPLYKDKKTNHQL